MNPIHTNFCWFVENYDSLYAKYGRCYLVIKDCSVIASYNDIRSAHDETRKIFEPGTFNIQYCDGSPSAYCAFISGLEILSE